MNMRLKMKIVGLDSLVFGVDDVASCCQYLSDYGLIEHKVSEAGGEFKGLDGTSIVVKARNDHSLPAPLPTNSMIRKTVYGVADSVTLEQIKSEMAKDREVTVLADGSLELVDPNGFVLGFQLTIRQPVALPAEKVNAPGDCQRPVNSIAALNDIKIIPRSLSHVVYFVPDQAETEAFYQRLGFVTVDRFSNLGPFMRPAGTLEHHTLFFIETPPSMLGVEHFTFHMAGPTEVLQAGRRFVEKGYESFWGPGRHIFGSNWFWYFNSPFGAHVEYDADMDLHDDSWQPRACDASADASQIFNFTLVDKWMPGGGPH